MKNLSLSLLTPPQDFQILLIRMTGNGTLDPGELAEVNLPAEVDRQKGLVLYGRAPIWLYAYLSHLGHASRWVAVYDPRCGGIVVQAHHPSAPPVASIRPREVIEPYVAAVAPAEEEPRTRNEPERCRHRAVAIVGPRHSGKSVFLYWLREALRRRMSPEAFHSRLFILRACPDGEGNWFFEAPESARTLRYKNRWDADFVATMVSHIQELSRTKALLFVDCGGIIDRFNRDILSCCTDMVIVSRDAEATAEWRGVGKACGLQVVAEVESVVEPGSLLLSANPLRVRVGGLMRGAPASDLPEALVSQFLPVA